MLIASTCVRDDRESDRVEVNAQIKSVIGSVMLLELAKLVDVPEACAPSSSSIASLLRPEPFTVAHVREAIAMLEANNVPPMRCMACGQEYYVFDPLGSREQINRMLHPSACTACVAKYTAYAGG